MVTNRHNADSEATSPEGSGGQPPDRYLDAAREALVAVGWSRTTLTDIARRAGVSRMTLYRAWPTMNLLLADLMTREWAGLVRFDAEEPDELERIAGAVVGTVEAMRENELVARIVELDPDLLLPYLLRRAGRSQEALVALLAGEIARGQSAGTIRQGDADHLARSLVLAAHGFALSAHTMGAPASFDGDLRRLVKGYLAP